MKVDNTMGWELGVSSFDGGRAWFEVSQELGPEEGQEKRFGGAVAQLGAFHTCPTAWAICPSLTKPSAKR